MERHLTSAQRALGIQEILCIVLGHFSPEKWLDTDEERCGKVTLRELRRNLANLARVSPFFSGPALSILWSVIDDLDPLLCLFGCSQWVQVEDDGSESEVEDSKTAYDENTGEPNSLRVLGGNVTANEWKRFQHYAGLVHICVHDYDPMIDPSVYLQLSLRNDHKPLLPNLRYLKWQQRSCTSTELLHIIGPSLRRLDFDFASSSWSAGRARRREYALKVLLDNACSRAPNVVELYLEGVHHPDTLAAIQGWKQLRHLSQDSVVEFAALEILSNTESVTSMWMDIAHLREVNEKNCIGFMNLETLSVEGNLRSLEWFFSATHLSRLQHLSVFLDEDWNGNDRFLDIDTYRRRLENLQIHVKYPKLKSFKLRVTYRGEAIPTALDYIQPLYALKDLEALDVDFGGQAHLSDSNLEELARRFPKLRSLKLDHVFTDVEPSIRVLDILARGFPFLEEVVLPSVCHMGLIPDPPCTTPHFRLRRMIFFRAMISDRARFSKYMRRVFPNVVPALPSLFYRRPCEDWCLIVDSFRPVHAPLI